LLQFHLENFERIERICLPGVSVTNKSVMEKECHWRNVLITIFSEDFFSSGKEVSLRFSSMEE
jgi:hypothetical protein